jgi:large exoprotein involved in heme utilization and adhesion
LRITTRHLVVRDKAEISVSSAGLGNAGELRVEANDLLLNNGGKLQASTASGEGGNIGLQVRDLILMRRNSLISAKAGNNGNGGNISIDTPFIVAIPSENSNIVANASRGKGGKIQIKTYGIFGLEDRNLLTPEITPESDISASSEFGVDGVVEIDTPDIDPSQGLAELSVQPAEAEVVQACQPGGSQAQSEFIITGHGGLPPSPSDALNSDAIQVDWVSLKPGANNPSSLPAVSTNSTSTAPEPIVEAQGWIFDGKGEVVLTASAPAVTPHSSWPTQAECRAPQSAPNL